MMPTAMVVSPMMIMMVMMVVVIMMIVVMIMVVMVVVVVEIDLIIEPNAIVETRTDPNHVIVTPARFDENCPFFRWDVWLARRLLGTILVCAAGKKKAQNENQWENRHKKPRVYKTRVNRIQPIRVK